MALDPLLCVGTFFTDVDECEIPGVCPKKLKCVNLPISYTCECRDGYKPRPGNSTDCLGGSRYVR